jgi:hypothetical protein
MSSILSEIFVVIDFFLSQLFQFSLFEKKDTTTFMSIDATMSMNTHR